MQRVGRRQGEYDFRITGDVDGTPASREQFVMRTRRSSISSSGETTISVCVSILVVAPAKFRSPFGEDHFVGLRRACSVG